MEAKILIMILYPAMARAGELRDGGLGLWRSTTPCSRSTAWAAARFCPPPTTPPPPHGGPMGLGVWRSGAAFCEIRTPRRPLYELLPLREFGLGRVGLGRVGLGRSRGGPGHGAGPAAHGTAGGVVRHHREDAPHAPRPRHQRGKPADGPTASRPAAAPPNCDGHASPRVSPAQTRTLTLTPTLTLTLTVATRGPDTPPVLTLPLTPLRLRPDSSGVSLPPPRTTRCSTSRRRGTGASRTPWGTTTPSPPSSPWSSSATSSSSSPMSTVRYIGAGATLPQRVGEGGFLISACPHRRRSVTHGQ